MVNERRFDVFISYSSKDRKVAEGVCGYLEANSLRCFIDYRDIPRGALWARVIPHAIAESAIMVVLFSSNYNKSKQVERELSLADKADLPIIPFRLEDTPYDDYKSYYFESLNWLDAFPEPEKVFGALLKDVMQIIKGDRNHLRRRPARRLQSDIPYQLENEAGCLPEEDMECYVDDYEEGVDCMANMEYADAMDLLLGPALAGYRDSRFLLRRMMRASYIRFASSAFWQKVRSAADKDSNGYAMCLLSRFYGFIDVDHNMAYEYAARSAQTGCDFGRMELAMLYGFGAGVERDDKRMLEELTVLARRKFSPAMLFLAREYLTGRCGVSNPRRALRMLETGAELGYADCICELGLLRARGRHVPLDREGGIAMIEQAMADGYPDAVYVLASVNLFESDGSLSRDPKRCSAGFELLNRGVEHGLPNCMSALADLYEKRLAAGENVAPALVLRWRLRAAENGDRYSMDKLIYHYYEAGDYTEAWRWAELSAVLGGNLGEYYKGEMAVCGHAPVAVSPLEGVEHLENALFVGGAGAGRSAYSLFCIYAPDDFCEGFPTRPLNRISVAGIEPDEGHVLDVLRRGAECGSPGCAYILGCALTDTRRTYSDEIEGVRLLKQALDGGRKAAAARLAYLYKHGIGVLPDADMARKYEELSRD